MEGCPRSLMLKLDLKESEVTSFGPALKRYIREFYHEDGETYSQECNQLEQLRTAVIQPNYDNSGCNLLRRYYGQIHLLKTRFPMGEGSPASVEFTWTDLYTEDPITISDISYEQSSILFNLGALHSLLASREDRVSDEGMKVACTHYQSAAGTFTYLKDNFSTDQYSDTSKDLLNLYINVMLGQAQECLLEKSMLDNRKNSLVARIAMQVQNYYTEAVACLTSSFGEILPPKMHKHWSKTLQLKCSYLNGLAYMYMSNVSDEQGKYGEKVAFLKIASQKLAEAQKLLKNQSQQMQEVVQFITDAVTQK